MPLPKRISALRLPLGDSAWRRLATGKGTIGDVAYMVHEVAEIEEWQGMQSKTGFDFMRRKKEKKKKSRRESGRWQTDFNRYYRLSHSKGLEAEYEFIAKQVYNVTNGVVKISKLQAAAIDPTRNEEAWEHLFVDGRPMQEHHHFYAFCKRAEEVVHLGASMQQRLGYYRKEITLKERAVCYSLPSEK